jgi:cytidine deaminase
LLLLFDSQPAIASRGTDSLTALAAVHAEQCAVARAWLHNEGSLSAVATTAPPCGHCRQFLLELPQLSGVRVLPGLTCNEAVSASDLLPHCFSGSDLSSADSRASGSLLLPAAQDKKLAFVDDTLDANSRRKLARDAADTSYAPYSGCPSGVALEMEDGTLVGGAQLESAAFNPTLPPLQCALSCCIAEHGLALSRIQCITVAERRSACVRQADTVRKVMPQVPVESVEVEFQS